MPQYTIGSRAFTNTFTPPVTPTFVYVDSAATFSCSTSSATCTVTGLTATTANSVFEVGVISSSFIASPMISSVSGGGGTWNILSSTYVDTSGMGVINSAYNLTNTGGATSVSVTLSSTPTVSWGVWAIEFKCTANCGSGRTLDVVSNPNANTASCGGTCTAAGFTSPVPTPGDLCVQFVNNGSGIGTPSSPYVWDSQTEFLYSLSTPNGNAPTYPQTSGGISASGYCFR